MADPPPRLARLLEDVPPEIVELVERCRLAILEAMPDASERTYLGWRGLGFHHPVLGYVCAVFLREDHVAIGFEHGHLLDDPDGMLTGTGRRVRYLPVTEWTHEIAEALDGFLAQTLADR